MNTKKIDEVILPDGTSLVTTPDEGQPHFAESRAREDVELQAALDAIRAQGISRPVMFYVADADPRSLAIWRNLLLGLRKHGIATWNAAAIDDDTEHNYILRPDRARELLREVLGLKKTGRYFRMPAQPDWPVSYWTACIAEGGLRVWESRTLKDMATHQQSEEEGGAK
jgi:hypothetical protein